MTDALAKALAERINGGNWEDPKFYTDEQRDLWRGHAAFLTTLPIAVEGRVKALEWVKHPAAEAWRADTMLGTYQVWVGSLATGWQFDGFIGERINEKSTDAVFAKAAAQTDYETRILSALISSPGKDGGQEVGAVKPLAAVDVYKVLKSWSDHGSLDIDHLSAISREVAALARPQPSSTALVEAPSPQSTVDADADAVIERLTKALEFYRDEWEHQVDAELTYGGWTGSLGDIEPTNTLMKDRGEVARAALKAKSPSSDRAASEGNRPVKTYATYADYMNDQSADRPSFEAYIAYSVWKLPQEVGQ